MTGFNGTAPLFRHKPLSTAGETCALCPIPQPSRPNSNLSSTYMTPRFHNPLPRSSVISASENTSHIATQGRFPHTNNTVAA